MKKFPLFTELARGRAHIRTWDFFFLIYLYFSITVDIQYFLIGIHFILLFFVLRFLKNYLIVVQVQLSALTPTPPPNPSHPHLPPLLPPHLGFVHVSIIVVTENPSSLALPLSSPRSPLVTVRLFLVSLSLVIFCLLACIVD